MNAAKQDGFTSFTSLSATTRSQPRPRPRPRPPPLDQCRSMMTVTLPRAEWRSPHQSVAPPSTCTDSQASAVSHRPVRNGSCKRTNPTRERQPNQPVDRQRRANTHPHVYTNESAFASNHPPTNQSTNEPIYNPTSRPASQPASQPRTVSRLLGSRPVLPVPVPASAPLPPATATSNQSSTNASSKEEQELIMGGLQHPSSAAVRTLIIEIGSRHARSLAIANSHNNNNNNNNNNTDIGMHVVEHARTHEPHIQPHSAHEPKHIQHANQPRMRLTHTHTHTHAHTHTHTHTHTHLRFPDWSFCARDALKQDIAVQDHFRTAFGREGKFRTATQHTTPHKQVITQAITHARRQQACAHTACHHTCMCANNQVRARARARVCVCVTHTPTHNTRKTH